MAPLAATLSDDVAFVIAIAATGLTPAETMLYVDRRNLELSGYGPEVVERAAALRRELEAWARDAGPPPDLASDAHEPWFSVTQLPRTTVDEAEQRRIARMDFDPPRVFAAVRAPILAFYGELDPMTPVEPSVAAWPPHATVVVVPEARHGLDLPGGTLAPLYERTLVDWLS